MSKQKNNQMELVSYSIDKFHHRLNNINSRENSNGASL